VIDPIQRIGWDCSDSNWMHRERFQVVNTPIHLSLCRICSANWT
jgi:hypothetical protein